jgi:ribosomal protein S18 acetylase RimI-like enzyme
MDGMTPATLRPATHDDGEAITTIDVLNHDPSHTPGPRPVPDRDTWERRDPADTIVAELDGQVVGYLALGHPTRLASNAHVWQVQGLAVHPDARRRGVARALLRAGVEQARQRGGRRVTLRVLGTNATARQLYASEGFVVEGVQRGEFLLDGREVDDVLMARRLD